jgi:hypothetical protein
MALTLEQQAAGIAHTIGLLSIGPIILRLLKLEQKVAEQQEEINALRKTS